MEPAELNTTQELPAEVLATMAEIGQEINASLDLDEVLSHAAAQIKRLIDYEIFAVLLLDENMHELRFRFAIGHRQEVVEDWRIPVGQGIIGAAASTGRAVRVSDVRKDSRYLNAVDAVQSELAVPLLVQGRVVGVLDIESRQLDYFTRDQQNILMLLASRISGAIENARLFERTRRQAETLLLLNEVARETNSILDVEGVLRRAAEMVKRVIDYQIFAILLYDETERVFRHRLNVKFGQHMHERSVVSPHEGIVGAAATLRRPVVVPDVSFDPRYISVNPETRSELAIPLLYKHRVVGVLDLESPQLNYFTPDHVQTLSILASHLAVSIENARLYEQVTRDEARMERDLNAARRLQSALLPPVPGSEYGLDIAARVVSSRELCGDLYDFLPYGADELGIALGDVSGKGSAAALYGAAAVGILRSLAPQRLAPAKILRKLNQIICERRIEGRFMTMCFLSWHPAERSLRIASAGQEQPLIFQNGRCEKIPLAGFPVGMFGDSTYDELGLVLAPGDIVVLYSDGVTDTHNSGAQFYGWQRLSEAVCSFASFSAAEIADRLLAGVDEFSGGRHPFDDRTLVVLKVI
ncbi:MAG TPA: GAF domain-containing SpoIIE family protein phosphatase [Candidatus Limnocylindrales bacterium]|nr:GAF domain-containing SpoIIE family protein phosphatase [Candidatus Limnocylindrales bacterium]